MIDKFATPTGEVSREFLDRNRTSKAMSRVSLAMPAPAPTMAAGAGGRRHRDTRAMIDKFAIPTGEVSREFLDRNRTSKAMSRVSPAMPPPAPTMAAGAGGRRHRDTRAMIDKFATPTGEVSSEFLDRNRTSKAMSRVSLAMPAPARSWRSDLWRTSISGR